MLDRQLGDLFNEKLSDQFLTEGFYAKPMNTKIHLSMGSGVNKKTTIVGNAVIMNIEESNEKIPVYSYNADMYKKYLNGKKIITGYIALRKTTVAVFLSLIGVSNDLKDLENQRDNESLRLKELNKIINNHSNNVYLSIKRNSQSKLNKLNQEIIVLKNKKRDLESYNDNIYQEMEFFTQIAKNDNLLYYMDNLPRGSKDKFNIKITYQGNLQNQELEIADVLFVKKQTEINIQKNDIIEVYQFIGNPIEYLARK